jgi:nitrogen regulatory protein PII
LDLDGSECILVLFARRSRDNLETSSAAASGNAATNAEKYVTVIIKPFRLEAVLRALQPFSLAELTVTEVRGYGRQKGHLELYRGAEYVIAFIPKVKLEFVLPALEFEAALSALCQAARTGRIGDGKVFVQDLLS